MAQANLLKAADNPTIMLPMIPKPPPLITRPANHPATTPKVTTLKDFLLTYLNNLK
jgi:hypothetical protein